MTRNQEIEAIAFVIERLEAAASKPLSPRRRIDVAKLLAVLRAMKAEVERSTSPATIH